MEADDSAANDHDQQVAPAPLPPPQGAEQSGTFPVTPLQQQAITTHIQQQHAFRQMPHPNNVPYASPIDATNANRMQQQQLHQYYQDEVSTAVGTNNQKKS